MKIKVTKDLCEIKENEIWNVGDYNVHTVQVELSPEFNGLVNKVRYFVEDNSYDMLITDNVAQVPYEATVMEGTIKIGVYGYDADTDILVQSTSPVNKYITSGTYTGDPDNTQPLTPTDKEQMETAIQKNTNDIIDLKANKQDKLISGVNIKTINNESILGTGNIEIDVGSINYNDLENKPKINNVELVGNKSLSELGIQAEGEYVTIDDLTEEIGVLFNEIETFYYNKTQTNNLLNNKQNTITNTNKLQSDLVDDTNQTNLFVTSTEKTTWNNKLDQSDLTDYVKNTDYATTSVAGVLKPSAALLVNSSNGNAYCEERTYAQYQSSGGTEFISKGTLENVITGKNLETANNKVTSISSSSTDAQYPSAKCVHDSQATQDDEIEALQTENERLKATLPTTTGEGQDVTLDKTAEMEFVKPPLPRGNSEQESTTGKNLLKPDGTPTTIRGVSWSYREDGAVVGERVSSNENTSDFTLINNSTFQPGSYIYSCFDSESTPGASRYQSNISINGVSHWGTGNYSFVLNEVSTIRVVLRVYPNFTGAAIFKPMIRLSSIQESNYEPYTGGIPSPNPSYPQEVEVVTGNVEVTISNENNTESKTLPVSLGNIELCKLGDYQDYFYKNNGKWYVHKECIKYKFTGNEGWFTSGYSNEQYLCCYARIPTNVTGNNSVVTNIKSNRFKGGAYVNSYGNYIGSIGNKMVLNICIEKSVASDTTELNSYLANNETFAYYPIEKPTNTEITDTTLISQLEEISKALSYQGQTNITSNTIALFDVEAYQSTKLILENLDSRLTLVEG